MCYKISKSDVASNLSRLTGKRYENYLMNLNRIDKQKVFNSLATFDIKGFGRLACLEGFADLAITNEVSRLTGKSFENSLMELNIVSVKPLK